MGAAQAIPYRWTCHACKAGNEPGTGACAQCGMDALASVARIEGRPGLAAPPAPPDPRLFRGPWPLHVVVLHAAAYLALPLVTGLNDEMEWMRDGWAVLLGVLLAFGLFWLSRPGLERVRRRNERRLARGVPLPVELDDADALPHVWLLLVLCALTGLGMWALFHYTRYNHFYWLGLVPIALMLLTAAKEVRLARQAQRLAAAEALPDQD